MIGRIEALAKAYRRLAVSMLFFALGLFVYAVMHPERYFPWGNAVTYSIYAVYFGIMLILFWISMKKGRS